MAHKIQTDDGGEGFLGPSLSNSKMSSSSAPEVSEGWWFAELDDAERKAFHLMAQDEEAMETAALDDEVSVALAASIESNPTPEEISPEDAAWVDSCLVLADPQTTGDGWVELREALLETLAAQFPTVGESGVRIDESDLVEEAAEEPTDDAGEDIESRGSIFRVWELEGTQEEEEEENELLRQLKQALKEGKFQPSSQAASGGDVGLEVDELVAGIGDLSLAPPPE